MGPGFRRDDVAGLRYCAAMRYASFREFYPFYLSEHAHRICRRLHFAGTLLVILLVPVAIAKADARWLWLAPVVGYGFAWIGHFAFEKNRPGDVPAPALQLRGRLGHVLGHPAWPREPLKGLHFRE